MTLKHILLIQFSALTEAQKAAIQDAAVQHGFEAIFADDEDTALLYAAEAEIIFSPNPLLPKAAPHLRWLCATTAGVNPFLLPDAFANPDAILSNSSGAYGVTLAEHILMLTLEMLRRQPEYTQIVNQRQWKRGLPIRSIQGSRITLLGTGNVGQETAVRLKGFAPDCLIGINRSGKNPNGLFDRVLCMDAFNSVLPTTDILISSLPGTNDTYHILNAERLAMLPDGALVVNVGRGTIIDEAALEAELRAERLKAALDVFEHEPLPQDSTLWDCPNLLITPHAAGLTSLPYTVQRIAELFLEDFERYCTARPLLRKVDRQKGY